MTTQHKDAIALLQADHRKVESLFKEFEGLTDRSFATKKKLADQICKELIVHTEIEETIFYPALRDVDALEDILDESLVEHASAKDLISQIMDMDADSDLYDAKVKVLSELIEHHVGEEEGEMFLKARTSGIDLEALGEEMESMKTKKMANA